MEQVYLIRQVGSNFYKLGRTRNINNRLQNIKTNNPIDIEIICIINTNDAKLLERKLLTRLGIPISNKQQKIHGEWFELDSNWVAVIKFEMETRFNEGN